MRSTFLAIFVVSELTLAHAGTVRGDDLPSDAAKRIKEYEGKVLAVKKQSAEAIAAAQAKLVEDLKVVQTTYAKADKLDEALSTRNYINTRHGEKYERIPGKNLPGDTAVRVQKYEAEAVAIGDRADAAIKAELDKAVEDRKGMQSAYTKAEKLDEAQTIRTRIEGLRTLEREVARFQGKWEVVRWGSQGRRDRAAGTIITIRGERLYFESNRAPWNIRINPFRFTLNLTHPPGPDQIDVNNLQGIYQLGDFKDPEHDLAICYDGVRPAEFPSKERLAATPDGQKPTIMLLKRVRN